MKENVEDENSKNNNSLYQNYKVSVSCNFQFRRLLNKPTEGVSVEIVFQQVRCLSVDIL